MKLMEKLIEEAKNYKHNQPTETKEEENQNTSAPQPHKNKAEETEIYQEIAKKEKEIHDELERLISEAQTLNDYGTLEAKIKEIDKRQGELEYESQQTVINQLKVKLANLDKDKFKQESKQRVENLIKSDENVKKDDFNEEVQQALTELENIKEEKSVERISELESIVNEGVNEQKSKSKLEQLLQKVEKVLREGAKATVEQVQKIKKELHGFYHSNNKFEKLAVDSKEDKVKEAMLKLENYSTSIQPTKPSFFRPAVIIPLSLLAVVGIGVIVMLVRNRRINKRKVNSN